MLNKQEKKYDVVIYGASGFTGKLVLEYFVEKYADSDVSWALAGRNVVKLMEVASAHNAPQNIDIMYADGNDEASIQQLVAQSAVVLTTVGPYQIYGENLVKACAESGTGYVDLCGEPVWMHQMIEKYQASAQQSGAKIIFSCGFDSIPFDLGVFHLQEKAIKESGAPIEYVKGRVRKMQGKFSGGTAASLKATLKAAFADKTLMSVLKNPYSLAGDSVAVEQPDGDKPYFDETLNSWVAPFIMAAINTRNIHRSNMLLGHMYSNTFKYDEMLLTGPGEQGEKIAHAVASDKSLSSDSGPKPGEGPSKEERDNGFYDVMFLGKDNNDKTHIVSVSATCDPGYASTSKMLAESAICLVENYPTIAGGIYTPAPSLGNALIKRLENNAGLRFKIEA
ncbi:saccharopine dehydrogenase NADP-binding domain-containing protein [Glaciecola sp. MH2013]|uniref:saccharopine dehydrogenase family protein n=1 Tax=Glaciecola sp. MH2013 TaxID=2785524 RepID=UPI00189F625F|nr:saccharopine dehydrogenase NADP-binding domain-containing protein [Glaciecola sp. MH2013]MBF7072589.1 saccharopine dehydrogenase NADP-binding domain-containing protein [Glaciecola sp. MH2013]